ncbi:MAG: hypothetical protein SNJ54_06660 [Anaerolineae bacterium]
MRQLHPVGQRERFLRRGVYRRLVDDTILEQWTLHELNGAYLARVDRDEPTGGFTLYEALFDADGWPVRYNEERFGPGAARIRVHRIFLEGVMQTTTSERDHAETTETALPLHAVPSDWPLIVRGLAAHVALRGGHGSVCDVSTLIVRPVVETAESSEARVLMVAEDRLWVDGLGVVLAAHNRAGERLYLDDGSSKSKAYASVE